MSAILDLEALVRERARADGWQNEGALNTGAFESELLSFSYEKIDPLTVPRIIANAIFLNDTDAQGTQQFIDTKKTTAAFSHGTTNGVKFGISITAKADFAFAGGSVTGSYENNFSETSTKTETNEQTWAWNVTIPVPKRSKVVASVIIQEATYNPRFEATLGFRGAGRLENIGSNHSYIWAYDLGLLFRAHPDSRVTVVDDKTIVVNVSGKFTGVAGISYAVEAKQYPIGDGPLIGVTAATLGGASERATPAPVSLDKLTRLTRFPTPK